MRSRMTHLSYWVKGVSLISNRWLIFNVLETSFKESDTNDEFIRYGSSVPYSTARVRRNRSFGHVGQPGGNHRAKIVGSRYVEGMCCTHWRISGVQ